MDIRFENILPRLIILITALPIHELAHGFTAYLLGDHTAYRLGRLTLNPFKHLDLIGTLMILFIGIGFAKPVPIDTRNFKHPRLYMAITALAGPLSNILLGILSYIIAIVLIGVQSNSEFVKFVVDIMLHSALINAILTAVNLMPIPPLDGSRLLNLVVPKSWSDFMLSAERYMMPIVLAMYFLNVLDGPIMFVANSIFDFIFFVATLLTGAAA